MSCLTRGADGMRPTPRALALADPVRVTLSQIQAAVLQREVFDPATADRTFRIGLANSIEVAVIPSLLARLAHDRARRLVASPADRSPHHLGRSRHRQARSRYRRVRSGADPSQAPRALQRKLPLPVQSGAGELHSAPLARRLSERAARADQPHRRYPRRGRPGAGQAQAEALDCLDHARLSRRAVRAAPGAGHHHHAVENLRAISPMRSGLATSPAPIELPNFTISLLWHASFDHDPGHVWLRQAVVGLASEVGVDL